MNSNEQLTKKLLSENVTKKQFIDNLRLDIVNGREVSDESVKEAIVYLREDAVARGVAQAKAGKAKAKARKEPAKRVNADDLLKNLF